VSIGGSSSSRSAIACAVLAQDLITALFGTSRAKISFGLGSQAGPQAPDELLTRCSSAGLQDDRGDDPLDPLRIGIPNTAASVGVAIEGALDLGREDVLPARDHHVVLAIDDVRPPASK
jgi:hypothetical protein